MVNKKEKTTIKREIIGNKYFWVLREGGKFKETTKYKRSTKKEQIIQHYEKTNSIDLNLLRRDIFPNFTRTITANQPQKIDNSQLLVTYNVFVNGRKVKVPYKGISNKGLGDITDLRESAKSNGAGYIKNQLIQKGLMRYDDELRLETERETFVNWNPKR